MGRLKLDILERFESKFIPVTESGCWIWDASFCGKYGQFRISRHQKTAGLAHRASWNIYRGEIPEGLNVCHRCDVPSCVNPEHLFLGTYTDNMQDASRKGRMDWKDGEVRNVQKGEAHHSSKLTEQDIREIRASAETGVSLARLYSVRPVTISRIRRRLIWRHI